MSRVVWVAMAILMVSVFGISEGAEIRVPSDYDTIQAALDAAVDGDEVVIADGTYQGEGNRDLSLGTKAITVRSENGPTNCIIDCEGTEAENHRGFEFSNTALGPDTILDGVTITNGYKSGGGRNGSGGAIFCAGGSPTIRNCILSGNYAKAGGGLYLYETDSQIENCVIQENTATNGGGVYANGLSNEPIMMACVISDNVANYDGGGIRVYQGVITISGCTITDNQAIGRRGGGVECNESFAVVQDCLIEGNAADWGGGFISTEGDSLLRHSIIRGNIQAGVYLNFDSSDVINCLIEGNTYDFDGAGILARGSYSTIRNCTVVGNRSVGRSVYIYDESDVDLVNNIIWGNDEPGTAQVFIYDYSTAAVSYCDIQGGQEDILLDWEGTLDWGDGNLDADPNFVESGYWDPNGTVGNLTDDFWVQGDYRLGGQSFCFNAGDPDFDADDEDTDLAGSARVIHRIVDIGAYESTHPLLTKVTVKAGKTRDAHADSCSLNGSIPNLAEMLESSVSVIIGVGPHAEVIDSGGFTQTGKKAKYVYKNSSAGFTNVTFDFTKGTFSITGKNLDLSGMVAPVLLEIIIDDYYGSALAQDDGAEDVINGKKYLPIQLLAGNTDAMRVDKVVCKPGKENNVGNLVVKGQLAAEGEVDLTTTDLTLHWGASEFPVLAGDEGFRLVGKTKYQYKKSPDVDDPATIVISIDFVKCTFQVVVKKTNWPWEEAPLNFGLEFGDFNEQEEVEF